MSWRPAPKFLCSWAAAPRPPVSTREPNWVGPKSPNLSVLV